LSFLDILSIDHQNRAFIIASIHIRTAEFESSANEEGMGKYNREHSEIEVKNGSPKVTEFVGMMLPMAYINTISPICRLPENHYVMSPSSADIHGSRILPIPQPSRIYIIYSTLIHIPVSQQSIPI
jgi:hypothetical protein